MESRATGGLYLLCPRVGVRQEGVRCPNSTGLKACEALRGQQVSFIHSPIHLFILHAFPQHPVCLTPTQGESLTHMGSAFEMLPTQPGGSQAGVSMSKQSVPTAPTGRR